MPPSFWASGPSMLWIHMRSHHSSHTWQLSKPRFRLDSASLTLPMMVNYPPNVCAFQKAVPTISHRIAACLMQTTRNTARDKTGLSPGPCLLILFIWPRSCWLKFIIWKWLLNSAKFFLTVNIRSTSSCRAFSSKLSGLDLSIVSNANYQPTLRAQMKLWLTPGPHITNMCLNSTRRDDVRHCRVGYIAKRLILSTGKQFGVTLASTHHISWLSLFAL